MGKAKVSSCQFSNCNSCCSSGFGANRSGVGNFCSTSGRYLGGLLAGGHLVIRVLTLYNWDGQQYVWWIALLGGILGALLALMMLDWALIILSSLIGANLVSQALPLDQATTVLLAILLAISDIVIQSRLLQRPAVVA
jgi:hypothetical protein